MTTTSTSSSTPERHVRVVVASEANADDAALTTLETIINRRYAETEGAVFVPGYRRISLPELRRLRDARHLMLAFIGDELVGCCKCDVDFAGDAAVVTSSTTPATSTAAAAAAADVGTNTSGGVGGSDQVEIGMLAVHESASRAGVGRALLRASEARVLATAGKRRARLELLREATTAVSMPFKAVLDAWYRREGYSIAAESTLEQAGYDFIAEQLVHPVKFYVYLKVIE